MQLSFTPAEQDFRGRLRSWLDENTPRDAAAPVPGSDEEVAYLRRWQQTLYRAGWCGLTWPESYGGQGAGFVEQVIYDEEMARAQARSSSTRSA